MQVNDRDLSGTLLTHQLQEEQANRSSAKDEDPVSRSGC
jgi:hypothetical protein